MISPGPRSGKFQEISRLQEHHSRRISSELHGSGLGSTGLSNQDQLLNVVIRESTSRCNRKIMHLRNLPTSCRDSGWAHRGRRVPSSGVWRSEALLDAAAGCPRVTRQGRTNFRVNTSIYPKVVSEAVASWLRGTNFRQRRCEFKATELAIEASHENGAVSMSYGNGPVTELLNRSSPESPSRGRRQIPARVPAWAWRRLS